MDQQTVAYYSAHAAEVADRYETIVNGMAVHFDQAFTDGARVLDLGCGSGRDMAFMLSHGRQAYGMDATSELIGLALGLHPELKGRIALGALPRAPVPFGGHFDGVLCSAVLMHVPVGDLPNTVRFIRDCLRPGGHLLYSVPSKRNDVTGDTQRDAAGRLFVTDSQDRLQGMFEVEGFSLIGKWGNSDSLGRDGVEWVSTLMKLADR